jgi:hypothetical protein
MLFALFLYSNTLVLVPQLINCLLFSSQPSLTGMTSYHKCISLLIKDSLYSSIIKSSNVSLPQHPQNMLQLPIETNNSKLECQMHEKFILPMKNA